MESSDLRKHFLEYFNGKGHKIVNTSPLIPIGDPSLLFTTAGMVQFKPMFSGEVDFGYTRATSCQKCLRTSDLDNVGKTTRHHTFFEMLGNFSFGDYFKKEAIEFAWEFSVDVVGLDPKRIFISVYKDDNEAYDLWTKHIGILNSKVVRLGKEDNFWGPAGDSGPCGPCSELYYDISDKIFLPEDKANIGGDNNRYIEYWNLVFNQYNRLENGELISLPKPGIDTGMGLERLALVSQGVNSVYSTDLFKPFIEKVAMFTGHKSIELNETPYQVIADHIRAIVFVLAENILPSNDGRGYVIRRILRRAMRYGRSIGIKKPFLNELVPIVVDIMGNSYSEIVKTKAKTSQIILSEEEAFLSTLEEGSLYLENLVNNSLESGLKVISGKDAFKLYDSMGFPIDITIDMANEKGMTVNIAEYQCLMDEQKKRGRDNWKRESSILPFSIIDKKLNTNYLGDKHFKCESRILHIIRDNKLEVNSCSEGHKVIIITDNTPFYPEGGGQVGDIGTILKNNALIEVTNTQKYENMIIHNAIVRKGSFSNGDIISLSVDNKRKLNTAINHSATHLLHYALKKVLGDHIRQLGSLVDENRLRFDFSHFKQLSKDEVNMVEHEVNAMIRHNLKVDILEMDKDKAIKSGASAFFGDKYGILVRTVRIGDSFELCGGTHVKMSGDIGLLKVISESSISSGTRRIEAITASKAVIHYQHLYELIKDLELSFNVPSVKLENRLKLLIDKNKLLEKEVSQLKAKESFSNIDRLINSELISYHDFNYISLIIDDKNLNELRLINDRIKNKHNKLVSVLISKLEDRVFYLSTVSSDVVSLSATDIVKRLSLVLDGRGGGKNNKAQGSGSSTDKIKKAKDEIDNYIKASLSTKI